MRSRRALVLRWGFGGGATISDIMSACDTGGGVLARACGKVFWGVSRDGLRLRELAGKQGGPGRGTV